MFLNYLFFISAPLMFPFLMGEDFDGSYYTFAVKKGFKFIGKPKEYILLEKEAAEAIIGCGSYCARDEDCKAFYVEGNTFLHLVFISLIQFIS